MTGLIRGKQWRTALSIVFGILIVATGATPALAASTPFYATYPDERTTFQTCPGGLPTGAICFTGVGHGLTVPPGHTSTESYTGFVDPNTQGAIAGCAVDHNVVSIRTSSGTLFLTTTGSACGAFDDGTWQAVGGTHIFEGATGSGVVHTDVLGANPNGTIHSSSTYIGTLNLHSE